MRTNRFGFEKQDQIWQLDKILQSRYSHDFS